MLALPACGDGESERVIDAKPEVAWPTLTCDPIAPAYCLHPYPSNVFTTDDPSQVTGRRLALDPAAIPQPISGKLATAEPMNTRDGFSPGGPILVHLPGATGDGLPPPDDLARSLEADSLTVLLDAETGERVAHFAELDLSRPDDETRTLIVRPVVRLEDARRYIVALRGISDGKQALAPSDGFRALRDKRPSNESSVNARRGLYEDIFLRLAAAGVQRKDLQLAWDFTTSSRQNTTERLLHMRDEAYQLVGEKGSEYEIDLVDTSFETEHIAFRIEGRMKAPLYLQENAPGALIVLGDDGLPEPNQATPTYDVPFELIIPKSALTKPASLLLYGHGLNGSRDQIRAGHFARFMNEYGYAMFAVDLVGMSSADPLFIAEVLTSGQIQRLAGMYDRMHQGALNYLLLMKMMRGRFAEDPTYGKYLDPTERYYHGISQGGIFGGVYMAVSPDVSRGVLGVMGQPYAFLLNRSVDFSVFFVLITTTFPDARDQQMLVALAQSLWDRVEPNGYTKYIENDPLPGAEGHSVLMRAAVGDHQVHTMGAHIMARAVGATHLDTGVRPVWGLEAKKGPFTGSAYVEYEFGLPPEPTCNKPFTHCEDPHGKIRDLPAAEKQMDQFLRTGVAENFCPGAVCSYPELGGCKPGQNYFDVCLP